MSTSGSNPTVFVVEDDAAVRDSLRFLLSSVGRSVRTFADAEDFLAADPVAEVGCIVLDVHLPGMDGLELLERLPCGVASLPVICLTAGLGDHLRGRAFKAGAYAFARKPLVENYIPRLIDEAIRQSEEGLFANARAL